MTCVTNIKNGKFKVSQIIGKEFFNEFQSAKFDGFSIAEKAIIYYKDFMLIFPGLKRMETNGGKCHF